MNKVDFLPLGTVLYVKGGFEKVMIISRGLLVKVGDGDRYFDYGACRYPQGMVQDQVLYFNQEDIAKIVFKGYEDDDSKALNDGINHWLEKLDIKREDTISIKNIELEKEDV